jgi:hypothetical protein
MSAKTANGNKRASPAVNLIGRAPLDLKVPGDCAQMLTIVCYSWWCCWYDGGSRLPSSGHDQGPHAALAESYGPWCKYLETFNCAMRFLTIMFSQ